MNKKDNFGLTKSKNKNNKEKKKYLSPQECNFKLDQ